MFSIRKKLSELLGDNLESVKTTGQALSEYKPTSCSRASYKHACQSANTNLKIPSLQTKCSRGYLNSTSKLNMMKALIQSK
jgi:hypothetical protein